jgi:nitrogenase-stabilizing/protective protein
MKHLHLRHSQQEKESKMDKLTLDEALAELNSAEDFLNYFCIEYDTAVVQVNRLHILQRFHNYLAKAFLPDVEDVRRAIYTVLLERAYLDFVQSDALTEKVFRVFHMHEPQVKYVPISSITVNRKNAA